MYVKLLLEAIHGLIAVRSRVCGRSHDMGAVSRMKQPTTKLLTNRRASMTLSVITACAPMMKPLFGMLQFSLIDSAIPLPGGEILLENFKARTNG